MRKRSLLLGCSGGAASTREGQEEEEEEEEQTAVKSQAEMRNTIHIEKTGASFIRKAFETAEP